MSEEWTGKDRRKLNHFMEERLQKLECSFSDLDKQLAILNAELPHLQVSLENTVTKITEHEESMTERMGVYVKCRDERVRLTEGVKWVWLVIAVLLVANTSLLIKSMLK